MKHIHIDLLGGIAGDMFLAASIDAGLVDVSRLEEALSSLGVGEIRVVTERVRRGAISGTHVRFEGWDPAEERDHRHLSTILEMLDDSGLSERVKARARQMFQTLGESESKVHDIPLETVHFHECGALDSIFDFVSAAFIIESVGDGQIGDGQIGDGQIGSGQIGSGQTSATWSAGVIPTGSGTVETDHGTVPIPVPATADILEGFELVARPVQAELVTPTGATILKTLRLLNPDFERPQAIVRSIGYGAGTRELDAFSNVVRFMVMETNQAKAPDESTRDVVAQLVCEIDDMNPELFSAVEAKLFDEGALDVVREPVLMKKGRQATRLSVLCPPDARDQLSEVLFRETTTFGVRVSEIERRKLARKLVEVELDGGKVHVKVGYLDGQAIKAAPEYEDCVRLAQETGQAVRDVYEQALVAWRSR